MSKKVLIAYFSDGKAGVYARAEAADGCGEEFACGWV